MQKHTFPPGSTAMEMATVCSRTGKGAVRFNDQVTNSHMEVRYKLSCIALPDTPDTLIKGNQRQMSNSFIQNFSVSPQCGATTMSSDVLLKGIKAGSTCSISSSNSTCTETAAGVAATLLFLYIFFLILRCAEVYRL